MPKITALRGLPGAGKSTAVQRPFEPIKGERPAAPLVVSRDAIRAALVGGPTEFEGDIKTYFDFPTEQMITRMAQAQAREAVAGGFDVLVDDTNLRRRYLVEWAKLALEVGAEFDIFDVKVPTLEVLLERNDARGKPLTEERLRDLWKRFPQTRWPSADEVLEAARESTNLRAWTPYTHPRHNARPNVSIGMKIWKVGYLVDIDGTIARKHDGRGYFEYDKVGGDHPIQGVIEVVRALRSKGYDIVFMSGREDSCRDATRAWLERNVGLWTVASPLHMRATGDRRADDVVKHELFHSHIQGHYHVLGVFDDRDRVVSMWREIGLPCYQVAPGAF